MKKQKNLFDSSFKIFTFKYIMVNNSWQDNRRAITGIGSPPETEREGRRGGGGKEDVRSPTEPPVKELNQTLYLLQRP